MSVSVSAAAARTLGLGVLLDVGQAADHLREDDSAVEPSLLQLQQEEAEASPEALHRVHSGDIAEQMGAAAADAGADSPTADLALLEAGAQAAADAQAETEAGSSKFEVFYFSPGPMLYDSGGGTTWKGYPFRVLADARAACAGIGARLATWAELSAAHAAGAEWCACGATGDNSWSYPMQVTNHPSLQPLQRMRRIPDPWPRSFLAWRSPDIDVTLLTRLMLKFIAKRVCAVCVTLGGAQRLRRDASGGPRVRRRRRQLLRRQAERGTNAWRAPLCTGQVPRARHRAAAHAQGRAVLLQPRRHEIRQRGKNRNLEGSVGGIHDDQPDGRYRSNSFTVTCSVCWVGAKLNQMLTVGVLVVFSVSFLIMNFPRFPFEFCCPFRLPVQQAQRGRRRLRRNWRPTGHPRRARLRFLSGQCRRLMRAVASHSAVARTVTPTNCHSCWGRLSVLTVLSARVCFAFHLSICFLSDQNADWCACGALSDNSWSYPIQVKFLFFPHSLAV